MDFIISIIVCLFAIVLSFFGGVMIITCLLSGILFMRRLDKKGFLIFSKYKLYVLSILTWIFIIILFTVIALHTKFSLPWLFGLLIGFPFSLGSLKNEYLENNKREFYRRHLNLFKPTSDRSAYQLNSLSTELFIRATDKVNLLKDILTQAKLEKHFVEIEYEVECYMYIIQLYKRRIYNRIDNDRLHDILIDYFELVSRETNLNTFALLNYFLNEISAKFVLFERIFIEQNLEEMDVIGMGFLPGFSDLNTEFLLEEHLDTVKLITAVFKETFEEEINV